MTTNSITGDVNVDLRAAEESMMAVNAALTSALTAARALAFTAHQSKDVALIANTNLLLSTLTTMTDGPNTDVWAMFDQIRTAAESAASSVASASTGTPATPTDPASSAQ